MKNYNPLLFCFVRLCSPLLYTALAVPAAHAQDITTLMNNPSIQAGFEAIKRNEPEMLSEQARFCEIAAPPFREEKRGLEFKRLFEELGLQDVHIDKAGNVIGTRPGEKPRPNLVLAAHLDTVFPEGTNVKVTREGSTMKAPGIGDDCRGLATLLGVIHALKDAGIKTPGTVTFVADVGEEGLGDLRGMKELFGESLKGKIDSFISIDGLGNSITRVGVGSYRYKVTFKGPGGHSYGAFGMANPIVAEENARWNNKGPVSVSPEMVGLRPAGNTPENAPIVQTALAVSKAMNLTSHVGEGSTDSNVPMNLGIPAITIGGGGSGTGAHSLNESYNSTDSWKGTERALLLTVALAR